MKQTVEYRGQQFELSEENRSFSGYGIVFNSDSVPMTIYDRDEGFVKVYEQITRDSIEAADRSDVIAAINHNFDKILGRTTAGTLELSIDEFGVRYSVPELPDVSYANDLRVSAARGDFQGSSFTFSIDMSEGYEFEERSNGELVARPKKITRIYEMGPVTNPAYPATTAENRSAALFESAKEFLAARKEEQEETPESENDDDRMKDFELRLRLSESEATL